MTSALAIVLGLLCGLLGYAGGMAVVPFLAFPDFPYADLVRPYFADADAPTVGAIAGIVVGVGTTEWLRRGKRSNQRMFGHGVAVALIVAAVLAGAQQLRLYTFQSLGLNIAAPSLELEIRLPAQAPPPHDLVQIELQTELNQAIAALKQDWLGADGGRPILRAKVALDFRASNRTIVLLLPDEAARLFRLRLNPAPRPMTDYSAWQQVDEIEDAGARRKAEPKDDFAIRYRVF